MADRQRAMEEAEGVRSRWRNGEAAGLTEAIATALLEAEARGVEWASTRAGYMECRDRAAELRAAKGQPA